MKIELDRRFKKKLAGRFGQYRFQVGILEDGPHKNPRVATATEPNVLGEYAGGPIRKKSRETGPLTIAQVSAANRARMRVNYLTDPFTRESDPINKFTREFFKYCFGRSEAKRLTNLLQAIVRNPILRGDYGSNSRATRKEKGFDRKMIDTAQFFKAIKAKVLKVTGSGGTRDV